jgi:hypothetical protein
MERKARTTQYLTAADLEMTEEQVNIAMRKNRIIRNSKNETQL